MSARQVAFLLAALGVALVVAGFAVGPPVYGIEGAYFTRASGTPAYSGVFAMQTYGLGSPHDGGLWVGAGVASLVLALLALAMPRWIGIRLLVVGVPLMVVGAVVGAPTSRTAYRNVEGWQGVDPTLPSLGAGNAWLGAGAACAAVALAGSLARRMQLARSSSDDIPA